MTQNQINAFFFPSKKWAVTLGDLHEAKKKKKKRASVRAKV